MARRCGRRWHWGWCWRRSHRRSAAAPVQPAPPSGSRGRPSTRAGRPRPGRTAERDIALASTWRPRPRPPGAAADRQRRHRRRPSSSSPRWTPAWPTRWRRTTRPARPPPSPPVTPGPPARRSPGPAARSLAATDRYEADRALLVDVLTETSTVSSVSAFVRVLSADTHEDLSRGLVALGQMGRSQSDCRAGGRGVPRPDAGWPPQAVAAAEQDAHRALGRRRLDPGRGHPRPQPGARRPARRPGACCATPCSPTSSPRPGWRPPGGWSTSCSRCRTTASFTDLDNWGRRGRHWATPTPATTSPRLRHAGARRDRRDRAGPDGPDAGRGGGWSWSSTGPGRPEHLVRPPADPGGDRRRAGPRPDSRSGRSARRATRPGATCTSRCTPAGAASTRTTSTRSPGCARSAPTPAEPRRRPRRPAAAVPPSSGTRRTPRRRRSAP